MQEMLARLEDKKGTLAKKKGGFTLVELIVVLVILAILAAILVPTLLGYINQANEQKDYATAQTVRVAAQSVLDDEIGHKNAYSDGKITQDDQTQSKQTAADLAGVNSSDVTAYEFDYDATAKNPTITSGQVTISGNTYYYYDKEWHTTAKSA